MSRNGAEIKMAANQCREPERPVTPIGSTSSISRQRPKSRRLRVAWQHAHGRPQALLTVTDEHFETATENGGLAEDKLGMQTPTATRTKAHKKPRTVHKVRGNASFSGSCGHP